MYRVRRRCRARIATRVDGSADREGWRLDRWIRGAWGLVLITMAAAVGPAGSAVQTGDPVPLFASHDPLELTLVADFRAIRGDRSEDPEDRPALLVLPGGDTLRVELRARGEFRRDPANCSLPPLRLDLSSAEDDGTAFAGQDKLKVVVPCHPERDSFEAYVLREYLIYRAYRTLTDVSFQVRLARITLQDATGRDAAMTRWAFFIEDASALAARVGAELMDVPEGKVVRPDVLHPASATQVALFQYLIGNTDWADAQVHNVVILAVAGPGLDTGPLVARFHDARPAIEEVYHSFEPMDARTRDETLAYYAIFYENVSTPERAQRRVFRDCKALP